MALANNSTIIGGCDHYIAEGADNSSILGGRGVRVMAPAVTAAGHRLEVYGARAAVFGSNLFVTADDAFVLGTCHGQLELTDSAIVLRRGACALTVADDGVWVETPATGRRPLFGDADGAPPAPPAPSTVGWFKRRLWGGGAAATQPVRKFFDGYTDAENDGQMTLPQGFFEPLPPGICLRWPKFSHLTPHKHDKAAADAIYHRIEDHRLIDQVGVVAGKSQAWVAALEMCDRANAEFNRSMDALEQLARRWIVRHWGGVNPPGESTLAQKMGELNNNAYVLYSRRLEAFRAAEALITAPSASAAAGDAAPSAELIKALLHGPPDAAAVAALLAAGADPNVVGPHGNTALYEAVSHGYDCTTELVRLLLAAGANPNPPPGSNGSALLMLAKLGHSPDAMRLLIDAGADPNVADPDGVTALAWAKRYHREEAASVLLAAGAKE